MSTLDIACYSIVYIGGVSPSKANLNLLSILTIQQIKFLDIEVLVATYINSHNSILQYDNRMFFNTVISLVLQMSSPSPHVHNCSNQTMLRACHVILLEGKWKPL